MSNKGGEEMSWCTDLHSTIDNTNLQHFTYQYSVAQTSPLFFRAPLSVSCYFLRSVRLSIIRRPALRALFTTTTYSSLYAHTAGRWLPHRISAVSTSCRYPFTRTPLAPCLDPPPRGPSRLDARLLVKGSGRRRCLGYEMCSHPSRYVMHLS